MLSGFNNSDEFEIESTKLRDFAQSFYRNSQISSFEGQIK